MAVYLKLTVYLAHNMSGDPEVWKREFKSPFLPNVREEVKVIAECWNGIPWYRSVMSRIWDDQGNILIDMGPVSSIAGFFGDDYAEVLETNSWFREEDLL